MSWELAIFGLLGFWGLTLVATWALCRVAAQADERLYTLDDFHAWEREL